MPPRHERHRRSPAWTFGDRFATYGQFAARCAELAGGLMQRGMRPGDRIVLLVPNCPELLETLFAAFWAGLVPVPLNWHLHPAEVAYIVDHCEARAILVSDETEAVLDVLPAGMLVLHPTGGRGIPFAEVTAEAAALAETDPNDPAWLFYTSGTTGRPKGATLTHRNLAQMTLNYYADIDRVAERSTFVHAAPLTHGSGLYLLPAVGRGGAQRHLDGAELRPARVPGAARPAPCHARGLRGAHDAEANGGRRAGGARPFPPAQHRGRRSAALSDRPARRHRRLRADRHPDLRSGRVPDDDHGHAAAPAERVGR